MSERYELREDADGSYRLVNTQGETVFQFPGEGYGWPNEDAVIAMLDDAGIGSPQRALFKTLLLGPNVVSQDR